MDINWPEVLIGGVVFLVVGAVFNMFVQPRLEKRLASRRESVLAKREAQDAKFAAEVETMAAEPDLYTARYREGVLRIVGLLLLAALLVLLSFVISGINDGVVSELFSVLATTLAILTIVPAMTTCLDLFTLAGGVRRELSEPVAITTSADDVVPDATEGDGQSGG